ncbi:MAG: nucleotidyltransferase family protein [Bacteroidia bacterium]|nr:nucleotidyltransferase family protein [Bacteroidia bacterium]
MIPFSQRLIDKNVSILDALSVLNSIAREPIAFVIDENQKLLGSLTDGDVRRGLLNGFDLKDKVESIIQLNPIYISKSNYRIEDIVDYKNRNIMVLPVVDENNRIVNVISLRQLRSYLPLDVVIMAGGKGERLKPLTDTVPKPMLNVADKPILQHNIDRLTSYGVDDFWISVNYLGDMIKEYFGNGKDRSIDIQYINEDKPLGTLGSVAYIDGFSHEHVLIMNSDILTNLDYEHFYLDFIKENADLSVVSIPYKVSVPYAVLENKERSITGFSEKPTYTYYSNGGIYLVKRDMLLKYLPKGEFFNATDLIEKMVNLGHKVISYHMSGYWLDIGKHEDYKKAQDDFRSIIF